MDFITKAKQTAGVMTLMLGAGFAPLPLSVTVDDEPVTSDMLSQGLRDAKGWGGIVGLSALGGTEDECRQNGQKYLKEHPEVLDHVQELPDLYRDLVLSNKERYYVYSDFKLVFLFHSDMMFIMLDHEKMRVTPLSLQAVNKWLILPQKGVQNPARRGRLYVSVPDNALNKLSVAQKKYLLTLQEVINENIHFLGNTPVPDWNVMRREVGGAFFAPTLVRPETFYEAAGHPQKDMNKTHDELVTLFADGNAIKYQIQERLGTPLFNPHKLRSDLTWERDTYYEDPKKSWRKYSCMGWGYCYAAPFGVPLLLGGIDSGGACRYKDIYHEEMQKSLETLQQGLKAELAQISPRSPLYPLLKSLVTQANRYLKEIDRTYDKWKRGKLKDVWTFLDPKGKYKPEELKEQEREIKRDTKKARKEEFKNKAAEPQLIYRKKDNRRRSEEERQRS